ncbi:MAG TPA: hypothetical protein VHE54_18265 [Puia sp.]|nr:hypothetical protein [Puia sp.]
MPYPNHAALRGLPKRLFSGVICLLLTVSANALDPAQFYSVSCAWPGHISGKYALYKRDTSRDNGVPGIVRVAKNGDILIAVPSDGSGHYRVRFYDGENIFLFEVRQVRDALLIVEKYNFRRAGVYQYEVYRDSEQIERNSFRINRS